MKVKELMDSLKGDCYRFRVHYPEEWEFGLITGATFFGKRGLVLQHGEDDVSSFTLKGFPSSRRFPAPLPSRVPQQPVCPWRNTTRRAMWSPRLSCLQIRF